MTGVIGLGKLPDILYLSDVVADILAGYANDAWFADDANIAKEGLHLQHGAYWKGNAIAMPDVASTKAAILKELHGSNYHQCYHQSQPQYSSHTTLCWQE